MRRSLLVVLAFAGCGDDGQTVLLPTSQDEHATTDSSGTAHFAFPAGMTTMGAGSRFLHVSAGPTYPLVEQIIALP